MAYIKHSSKGYVKIAGHAPEYTKTKSEATNYSLRGANIQASKLTNAGHGTHTVEN